MRTPLVSIITVSYNSARTIRRTIESVLHQTYTNIEYWIIDGASSDETVSIAKEYENAFEKRGMEYHILSEPDRGIYDAMNKGIRLSHGEIIKIETEPTDKTYTIKHLSLRYNGFYYTADLNLTKQTGTAKIASEYYH